MVVACGCEAFFGPTLAAAVTELVVAAGVALAIEGLPFDLLGVMVNQQNFTKTANCWGVGNNRGGTNSNRIVLAVRR